MKISNPFNFLTKKSPTNILADGQVPVDPAIFVKRSLFLLIIGLGGFIIWASLAPIDEGVVASGSVVLDGRRKTVQHFSGGIVKTIYVKEGEEVKLGQILIQLDDAREKYELQSVKSQMSGAELQLNYFTHIRKEVSSMVDDGYFPKNKFLEIERQIAELKVNLIALNNRGIVAANELKRTQIISPASGKVMGLSIFTSGAVIPAGGKIADIVPFEDRLVIEALVDPRFIDKLHHGLEVEVRFSALRKKTTPIVLGKVDWISGDRFNSDDKNNPGGFYLTKVLVSQEELKNKLPDEELKPGMPAEVIIKTGERTFFEYLLKPMKDRFAISLKEH